jgi:2-amino-4-hydroxy-6-hydroxymethyldihydropteridine diphosphokinase
MDPSLIIKAFVGLGSNMGDREGHLIHAVRLLHNEDHIAVIQCSNIYETEPIGYVEQPPFLNMVIEVETVLGPQELLARLLFIEQNMGRTRMVRWGPRNIDLDLLLYDRIKLDSPDLTLPHPQMFHRPFVMIPLQEIMGSEWETYDQTVMECLQKADGKAGVTLWKKNNWLSESGHFVN